MLYPVVQGRVLEFAPSFNDWQTCLAGITEQLNLPVRVHSQHGSFNLQFIYYIRGHMLEPPNQITVAIFLNFELNTHSQSNPYQFTPQILLITKRFGFWRIRNDPISVLYLRKLYGALYRNMAEPMYLAMYIVDCRSNIGVLLDSPNLLLPAHCRASWYHSRRPLWFITL